MPLVLASFFPGPFVNIGFVGLSRNGAGCGADATAGKKSGGSA